MRSLSLNFKGKHRYFIFLFIFTSFWATLSFAQSFQVPSTSSTGQFTITYSATSTLGLIEELNPSGTWQTIGGGQVSGSLSVAKTTSGTYTYRMKNCTGGRMGLTCAVVTGTKSIVVALQSSSSSVAPPSSQSSVATRYIYDALGRITEVRQNAITVEGYEYDKTGNRCRTLSSAPSTNVCSTAASTFTSTWNYGSTSAISNFQTSDHALEITWAPANSNGLVVQREYRFRHTPPGGSASTTSVGITYSKNLTNLSSGTHTFEVHSCGVLYYDEDEYEVTGCTAWLQIVVTIS